MELKMKEILKKSAILSGSVGVILSQGCSTQINKEAELKIEATTDEGMAKLRQGSRLNKTYSSVEMRDQLYVGGKSFKISEREYLPDFFNHKYEFNQIEPISFQELVMMISEDIGARIIISNDAAAHLQSMGGGAKKKQNTKGKDSIKGFAPVPSPGSSKVVQDKIFGNITDIMDTSGEGLVGSNVKFTLDYSGTLKSMLDYLSSKANVFWRWKDNHILIFRQQTKTFILDSVPSKSTFSASISSTFAPESGKGANSAASQSTTLSYGPESIWKTVSSEIAAIMSADGKMGISEEAGTITVTDTPRALDMVEEYLDQINNILGKKISVKAQIYEVFSDVNGNFNLDWNIIFSGSNTAGLNFSSLVNETAEKGLNNISLGIIDSKSPLRGSNLVVNSLNKFNNISLKTSSVVHTTNGQPVPIQVLDEITYLAEISQESSGSSSTNSISDVSLTPGVVTQGLSMNIMPRVMSDGDVMLQVAADMSVVNDIAEYGTESIKIQMPNRSTKNFLQRVSIKPGQTLLISGFERTINEADTQSVATKEAWFLGGSKEGKNRKVMSLVLLTPYVMSK